MNKVKNKKIVRKIADRTLQAKKSRNLIGILAIVLTSVLFTAVFTIGGSLVKKQQEETMRQVDGSAHAGYKYLTKKEYDTVKKDKKLKAVSGRIVVGDAVNEEFLKLPTEIGYYEDLEAKWSFCYPEVGHMPQKEDELVTSDLVLKALGIPCQVGEKVPVKVDVNGTVYEKTFTLSGYFKGDAISMAQVMAVSKEFQEKAAPQQTESRMKGSGDTGFSAGYYMVDFYFPFSFSLEKQVEALTKRCGFPETASVGVNWAYLGQDLEVGTVLGILGMMLMVGFAGYLLIYNVFYINVYADIRYYGLLKTVGTTTKQLKRMIRRQAYMLSAIGIPIGMLLGAVVGMVLLPVIMNHLTFAASTTSTVQWNPWIFLWSGLFSLITVRISCQKPGTIASKVSPIEAVRFTEGQNLAFQRKKKGKKKRKTRTVSPTAMAAANLGRNKKKLCIVVASLSLSLILVNTVYSLIRGFNMDQFAQNRTLSDYMVFDASLDSFTVSGTQVLDGVTKEFQNDLKKQKGVTEVRGIYIKELEGILSEEEFGEFDKKIIQNPEVEANLKELFKEEYETAMEGYKANHSIGTVKYYGIDQMIFDKMESFMGKLDWEAFSSGKYVIATGYLSNEHQLIVPYHEPGEKVILKNEKGESKEYEVLAVSEIPYAVSTQSYGVFDCTYILPNGEFQELFGPRQPMRLLFNVEKEQEKAVEAWVEHYCTVTNSNLQYISKSSIAKEFSGLKNMYVMIGGMLAFILALIGILNFLNTMAASILSRKQEFAALEAVGMTGRQLKTMLCTEGIYYAAGTMVIAVFVSVILNLTVLRGLENTFFFFKNHFTLLPLVLCIVPLLLVVLAVPILGYQNIRRQSVVERMREGEV